MKRWQVAVLCGVIFAGGGLVGSTIESGRTQSAMTRTSSWERIASDWESTATKAAEVLVSCVESRNEIMSSTNTLIDVVFDLPLDRLAEIRNEIPKPPYFELVEVSEMPKVPKVTE